MNHLELEVPGVETDVLRRAVARLLEHEPETIAVLLTGSHAKGIATAASDLDLTAITRSEPAVDYRMWFEEDPPRPPLHVSAAAATHATYRSKGLQPATWSFGFPAVNAARMLWSTAEARALLGDEPSLEHPAGEPLLEDLLEFVLKAKKSARRGDEEGLRLFAQLAASLAPRALLPVNEPRVVTDRRDALEAALSLPEAPPNYRRDVTICLGLAAVPALEVREAITRLALEVFAFLRERAPGGDSQPDIARYLADGTLEEHVQRVE